MGDYTTINEKGVESGSRFERVESDGSFSLVEPRISTLRGDPELVKLLAKENPDSLVWRHFDAAGQVKEETPFVE